MAEDQRLDGEPRFQHPRTGSPQMPDSIDAPRLAIIADDLTGALDCAAAFVTPDGEPPPFVSLRPGTEVPDECGVVSVNADSRRLPPDAAREAVRQSVDEIASSGDSLRYVKIDSTLRGHPGLEIEVAASASAARIVLVTPAFPATDRVVVGGEVLVNGIPLNETEVGQDPLSPASSARVREVLSQHTDLPITEIPLKTLRSGSLVNELSRSMQDESLLPVLISCDAETDLDLDSLVEAGLSLESSLQNGAGSVLFAGSAGLASALARSVGVQIAIEQDNHPAVVSPPVLVVTASQRSLADHQIAALVDCGATDLQIIEFGNSGSIRTDRNRFDTVLADASGSTDRNLVLRAVVSGDLSELTPQQVRGIADSVTSELAKIVVQLSAQRPVSGLVIIGGDTAHAILMAIEARGIVLAAEPLPGVPVGTIIGGVLDGVPIATKAGAFGDTETLVKLFDYFGQGKQRESEQRQ